MVAQREPPLLAVRAALSMISSAVGSFGHPPLGLRRYGAGLQPRRWLAQALIYWIFSMLSLTADPRSTGYELVRYVDLAYSMYRYSCTGHAMCFMTQYVFMTETKHLRISQKHSMRAIFMQI